MNELVEIELRLPPALAAFVEREAKRGILGDTPEQVIDHCLRQYLFEQRVEAGEDGHP